MQEPVDYNSRKEVHDKTLERMARSYRFQSKPLSGGPEERGLLDCDDRAITCLRYHKNLDEF